MIKVLVADPNPAFAAMIAQVLEETKRFQVTFASTGAEAIGAASRDSFDIVILETSIEDFSLRDAVTVLRRNQPYLPIMVILPFGEQALPDAAKYFDVQGILSKPLYIPDLQKQIESALAKPVNGVTPPPRNYDAEPRPATPHPTGAATPTHPPAHPSASVPASARRPAPPAPAWLDDVGRAAQYLTTLTLESSASAALLMRGQQLIAFAGQCSKRDADELASVVAANWAKDGGGGGQGAQVRFLHLSSGADYLVYSTLAAAEVVLSMAFQAETPLGQIRKQAKRATEALLQAPAIEATAPAQTQLQTADATQTQPSPSITGNLAPESPRSGPPAVAEPATIEDIPQTIDWASSPAEPPADTSLPIDWASILTRPPTDIPMPIDSALLSAHEEAADQLHTTTQQTDNITTTPQRPPQGASPEWEPALDDLEPIPDEAALNELSNTILQLSRQSLNQSLVEPSSARDLSPTPLPKVRRTPHSLYDLSYTFLIIPRLPTTLLTGDLRNRVEGWLLSIADAYDWQTQSVRVEPDHVEISLGCLPTDSPESVVKALILETSDKVLTEFPRLAADHARRPGNFWAPAYYVVVPGRPLSPEEVGAFVEYQRREQGGGKY